jgi:hypothetical protein
MSINEARLIVSLRQARYSLRAIAEAWYPHDHPFHGNQGEGQELLREACDLLGRTFDEHEDDFCDRWRRDK